MSTKTPTSAAKRGAAAASAANVSAVATPSPSGSHHRAPSPARIMRVQEKEQLTHLNDRLAAYIDRVKQLEMENSRLSVQIRTSTESSQKEVVDLRGMYQAELASARKLLDETSKENAKLQIEVGKARSESEDLRVRFAKRDKDASTAERRVAQLEAELGAIRPERDALRNDLSRLQQELDMVKKQFETCKKQLEDETLLRVDLQNQIQTMKEEMHFTNELHSRELEKSVLISSTVREEQASRYQAEYEQKLDEAIQELRDQYAADLRQAREDANAAAERRLREVQAAVDRQTAAASSSREEMLSMRRRYDEQAAELARLQHENGVLQKRIAEFDATAQRDRKDFEAQLAVLRADIERLQRELLERDQEYQDLYDVKIQLDYEIGVYRKLLEAEEVRLNLSDTESPVQKRRRVEFGSSSGDLTSTHENVDRTDVKNYVIENLTHSNVEFTEVELSGARYIRLSNNSTEDMPLGGSTLHHRVGELDTTYKFAKQLVLKAGSTVTVFSADANATHNPPSELVMKNQKWTLGDDMRTVLLNSKGDQLCSLHMRLRVVERVTTTTTTTTTTMRRTGALFSSSSSSSTAAGASKTGDKQECLLM